MKITVNGVSYTVDGDTISYTDLVSLIFGYVVVGYPTITYYHGTPVDREGSLLPYRVMSLAEGMIFNVTFTGNA